MTFDFDNSDELLVPGSAKWKAEIRKEAEQFVKGLNEELSVLRDAVAEFAQGVQAASADDEGSLIRVNNDAHTLHLTFELICGATGGIVRNLFHTEEGTLPEPPAGQSWN